MNRDRAARQVHDRSIRRARGPVAVLCLVVGILLGAATASAAPPRVTVFGDSVQASFGFTPRAVDLLGSGLDLRMEARVCRKLSAPGCLGGSPESVLSVARALGPRLGDLVVVHVGYNDFAAGYDIDAVLAQFRRAGVRAVVWVTLREAHAHYATTNARIREAVRRARRAPGGPVIRIADWNAGSVGRPWFVSDGVHLNSAGAIGLAELLRERVVATLEDIGVRVRVPPPALEAEVLPAVRPAATAIAGDDGSLWFTAGRRLYGLDAVTGRRLTRSVRLRTDEALTSDGRQAWLSDPRSASIIRAETRVFRAGPPRAADIGLAPRLARAGGRLWVAEVCAPDDARCRTGDALVPVDPATGERRGSGTPVGEVIAAAAEPGALWLLVGGAGAPPRLELRAPRTGDLIRSTELPPELAAGAALTAGRRGAWVLSARGRLRGVTRDGALRRVRDGVLSVTAAGDGLWVVLRDRRTVLRLRPSDGRILGRVAARQRLSGRMAATRRHVWVLTASGRQVVRVPR